MYSTHDLNFICSTLLSICELQSLSTLSMNVLLSRVHTDDFVWLHQVIMKWRKRGKPCLVLRSPFLLKYARMFSSLSAPGKVRLKTELQESEVRHQRNEESFSRCVYFRQKALRWPTTPQLQKSDRVESRPAGLALKGCSLGPSVREVKKHPKEFEEKELHRLMFTSTSSQRFNTVRVTILVFESRFVELRFLWDTGFGRASVASLP